MSGLTGLSGLTAQDAFQSPPAEGSAQDVSRKAAKSPRGRGAGPDGVIENAPEARAFHDSPSFPGMMG